MRIGNVQSLVRGQPPQVLGTLVALAVLVGTVSVPLACGKQARVSVAITSPADGDTVRGNSVTITWTLR
jgi:hypothetical protein